jgi:branched-chain amino acid transport system ATP-binding protein
MQRTFQNLQIFFSMTAVENVMVGASRRLHLGILPSLVAWPSIGRETRQARAQAEQLMADVGLSAYIGRHADAMPYGALKRLEIARALAANPEVLMLDEPIAARGVTVLLVEHDMKLVMAVSDRVIVLDLGKQIASGSPDEVRQNPEVIKVYLGEDVD